MSPILWTQSPAITNSLAILVKKIYSGQPEITDDNKPTNNSSENESDIDNKNQPENQNNETINHHKYHKQATIVNNKINQQINKRSRK